MIFGNITQEKTYAFLPEDLKECFAYAKEHDLASYEKGCHPIDGERLFVNVVEYETTRPENRFWEAHRNYLDVHLMLAGQEQIDLNFIENMEQKEYVEKDDFLPMDGAPNSHVVLRPGDFLICYPEDGHRTAVAVNEPEKIKKAIFKVRNDHKKHIDPDTEANQRPWNAGRSIPSALRAGLPFAAGRRQGEKKI